MAKKRSQCDPDGRLASAVRSARLACLAALLLQGCATPPHRLPIAETSERSALALSIMQLSPSVETAEAGRLSDLAFGLSTRTAREVEGVDPPVKLTRDLHFGFKTSSFCHAWADRFFRALRAEPFDSLELHAVMSPTRTLHPIEHSAVIVTARGRPLAGGLLLDPCRYEGRLYWRDVGDDRAFDWQPRDAVLWEKRFGRRPWYAQNPLDALIQTARPP
ncbi:hypothetical protein [Salipiger bermudensis]|uniref:hypothetical protein n=1 Tax=Salipiger bermudensis TaxID=344736 RepID=UPI001A8E83ED|nr:hypothetical protein [Salipiger bermudensis]MBN9677106.1 hypothetical protein [Salipiger bermudensis]MBR9893666.1 hypothetical protein [bacterium]MCA1286040.1 hypothetical protein [Salipiger bermudensis]